MNQMVNKKYCILEIKDHDEIVRYTYTRKTRDQELHFMRRLNRVWYEFTEINIKRSGLTKEDAMFLKKKLIIEFEKKHGRKPRYNRYY